MLATPGEEMQGWVLHCDAKPYSYSRMYASCTAQVEEPLVLVDLEPRCHCDESVGDGDGVEVKAVGEL